MNNLENISFDKLKQVYSKFFTLGYLNTNLSDKLACIALTCYITNEVKKKNKKITCYDILLKIKSDSGDVEKNTFLKSLGVICDDFMYGCEVFPTFGVTPKEMPKQLKILLDKYCPF